MPTVHEQLSKQFYAWESRGRGWQVFAEPVQPEPPFRPFNGYRLAEVADDGRRPTVFSSLFRKFTQPEPEPVIDEVEEPEPIALTRNALVEFQALLPADLDVSREAFDQFFNNVSICTEPLTFELLGVPQKVFGQFVVGTEDASLVRRQLKAYFPAAQFIQTEGTLERLWMESEGQHAYAVEFGLESEFVLPLTTGRLDSFIGIIGALAELQPNELALFQVLWQPVQNDWAESIHTALNNHEGKPLFSDTDGVEIARSAESKISRPLFAAVVRILVRAESAQRVQEIIRELAGSLRAYENPEGNALIPLHNKEYPSLEAHLEDVLRRQSRRSGMILNSDELFGFVHLPTSAVRSPALVRESGKTKAAPASTTANDGGVWLGDNEHNGQTVPVYLTADQRVRHTHIIGSSGTGKSSLLFNLIRQDIERGEGVAVLDPHGDLIDQILSIIPEERIQDVVLLNPADVDFPIGFNILQAHSEVEKNLLASDLIAVFRRLSSSWGDQMDAVLQNAILVFLESNHGGTLGDLRRFLLEPPFRSQFLQTVQDPEIIYYWQKVFPTLSGGRSIGPILTRLQDFFARKPLRNMVSQSGNNLDFADIMDSGKIFLAKLSEGLCGAENSYLLGTLLVSKFQQLAMARQSQRMDQRRAFWLYVDEFDHFITPTMAAILKGARKYRLGLILSHQELHQLRSDPIVESAVLTQACTRIVFRVGDDDAKKLGDGFTAFDSKAIKTLENYHAIVRVERNDADFNLAVPKPELPDSDAANVRRVQVIAASRAKYAVPREKVEAELLAKIRTFDTPAEAPKKDSPPSPRVPTGDDAGPKTAFTELRKSTADRASENTDPTVSEIKPPTPEPLAPVVPLPAPPPPTPVEPPQLVKSVHPAAIIEDEESPKDLGRGQKLHTTIQKRIQTEARALGYKADIEKQLAKFSMQAADVVLEDLDAAVEIAVTGGTHHEFRNIKKCLDAGFARVFSVSTDRKRLQAIADAVQGGLGDIAHTKVSYLTPDELIAELKRLAEITPPKAALPAGAQIIGGCLVEDVWPEGDSEEQKQQEDINFSMVADILKRTKKKKKPSK